MVRSLPPFITYPPPNFAIKVAYSSVADDKREKPMNLAFAWTRYSNALLILGQINFFLQFDVGFVGNLSCGNGDRVLG